MADLDALRGVEHPGSATGVDYGTYTALRRYGPYSEQLRQQFGEVIWPRRAVPLYDGTLLKAA